MRATRSKKFPKFTIKDSIIDLEKINFEDILDKNNPIIFDTNFLFITFEFKIDIIEELRKLIGARYNLYIYEGTIGELESIERKGDKNKAFLPLIIKMLKLYNFKIIKSNQRYIDDQIIENLHKNVLIATNDKELRIKIQKKVFRVMYLRQKSYLEIH